MDFDFNLPIRVLSGKGVVLQHTPLLRAFGKRCLIVTGGKSAALSGALKDVKAALISEDIAYDVFSEVGPNPLLSVCRRAGALANEAGASFIVGIGGGSALDAAKAAAVFAANPAFAPISIRKSASLRCRWCWSGPRRAQEAKWARFRCSQTTRPAARRVSAGRTFIRG